MWYSGVPFDQNFRSKVEWNENVSGKVFEILGIRFELILADKISGIAGTVLFHARMAQW